MWLDHKLLSDVLRSMQKGFQSDVNSLSLPMLYNLYYNKATQCHFCERTAESSDVKS